MSEKCTLREIFLADMYEHEKDLLQKEIDRLTAKLAEARERYDLLMGKYERMRSRYFDDENNRYREALERIADSSDLTHWDRVEIAREALKEDGE